MALTQICAQGQGVDVLVVSPKLVDTGRGRIISVSARVSNRTAGALDLAETMTLPAGWQAIVPDVEFTLDAGQAVTRLKAFQVPSDAPAGRYDVVYAVHAKPDPSAHGSEAMVVAVLPTTRLDLQLEAKPDSALAGESYEVRARLISRGNNELRIALGASTDKGYPATVEPAEVTLAGGQSAPLVVRVQTDKSDRVAGACYLRVTAGPVGGTAEDRVTLAVSVEVIPVVSASAAEERTLPMLATLRFGGDQDNARAQFEVRGSGPLDTRHRHQLDFGLRGPDTHAAGMFGLTDEYYASYEGPSWRLRVGDQSYGLSALTSYYKYGRGIGIDVGGPGLGAQAGAYYLRDRWTSLGEQEVGAHLGYAISPRYSLRTNLLRRTGEAGEGTPAFGATLWSVECMAHPLPGVNLGAEYALGYSDRGTAGTGHAWRIEVDGPVGRSGFFQASRFHAGPDYEGYYSDSDYSQVAVSHPISRWLQGHASFNRYAGNLGLRPILTSADRETMWRAGLSLDLRRGWSASLDYEGLRRYDALTPASFDSSEYACQLVGGWSGQNLSVRLGLRAGALRDRLAAHRQAAISTNLSATWRPTKAAFLTLHGSLGDDHSLDGSRLLSATNDLGAALVWQPTARLAFDGWVDVYNYTGSRPGTTQASLSVSYTLPSAQRIGLELRHTTGDFAQPQTAYLVTWSIPLGLPLGKVRHGGTVTGRIVDLEAPGGSGLARVVLRLHGAAAASGANGDFVFTSVPPGRHQLSVDRASIGLTRTLVEATPVLLTVVEGETSHVLLSVVRSATVIGRLVIVPRAAQAGGGAVIGSPNPDEPEASPPAHDVLVEMTCAGAVERRLTDRTGAFRFDGLRPGAWHLKVYPDGLPDYTYLETPEQDLTLEPGSSREVVLSVLPRSRVIRFIDQGTVSTTPK